MPGKNPTLNRTVKILRIIAAVLALVFGLYPVLYFLHDEPFRLQKLKSIELLMNKVWRAGFYTHIAAGGLALLVGWAQFSRYLRTRQLRWHRRVGKIYVVAALFAGLAGIYLSFHATGGLITFGGFFLLGIVWVYTTAAAYLSVRQGLVARHQELMIYSYACCFAAATLRLWLTGLGTFLDFRAAYQIVSWLSWVPNVMVAYFIVQRLKLSAGVTLL